MREETCDSQDGTAPRSLLLRHADAPLFPVERGRLRGLRHRTIAGEGQGARELSLWAEEHLPGLLIPAHWHDCEEILTVISGRILAFVGDFHTAVGPGESLLVPAGARHGYEVISPEAVRLLVVFASPRPLLFLEDGQPAAPPWEEAAHAAEG